MGADVGMGRRQTVDGCEHDMSCRGCRRNRNKRPGRWAWVKRKARRRERHQAKRITPLLAAD